MTSRSWLYRWWLRAQARWLVDVMERRKAQDRSEGNVITAGTTVGATDANGKELTFKALSGVEAGHSFRVVWVEVPLSGGGTDRMPWPAEFVRELTGETP